MHPSSESNFCHKLEMRLYPTKRRRTDTLQDISGSRHACCIIVYLKTVSSGTENLSNQLFGTNLSQLSARVSSFTNEFSKALSHEFSGTTKDVHLKPHFLRQMFRVIDDGSHICEISGFLLRLLLLPSWIIFPTDCANDVTFRTLDSVLIRQWQ